jgi:hypothetical protein
MYGVTPVKLKHNRLQGITPQSDVWNENRIKLRPEQETCVVLNLQSRYNAPLLRDTKLTSDTAVRCTPVIPLQPSRIPINT